MTSQDNKYELSPMGKKLPEAGKYPKLRPEQLGAILDRKENSVNSRYIAADITDKAILKFYAQLRQPQPFKPTSNASLAAQKVFSTANANATAAEAQPQGQVIDMKDWQERQPAEVIPGMLAPEMQVASPASNQTEVVSKNAVNQPPVASGLDLAAIRQQIADIQNGATKGKIINDSRPDVAQQFDALEDTSVQLKEAA